MKTENIKRLDLIGRYVIVRCRDAGVHAGVLAHYEGREAHLIDGRRLWYWRPAKGAFLSGCAVHGLASDSEVGAQVDTILTENCEILACSEAAAESIASFPNSHESPKRNDRLRRRPRLRRRLTRWISDQL